MIRRPHAANLVKENLKRARNFLAELEKDSELKDKAHSINAILNIVEHQLEGELNFQAEVQNTEEAGKIFGTFTKPLSVKVHDPKDPNGSTWSLQVPQIFPGTTVMGPGVGNESGVQVMIMEKAEGTPFDKISDPNLKAQAGRIIVSQAIGALFNSCFFNADPHKGNFLFNEKDKVIYLYDWGQAGTLERNEGLFTGDDPSRLAEFLLAVYDRNLSRIMHFGLQLSSESSPSSDGQRKLSSLLKEILQSKGAVSDELLIRVLNSFNDSGLPFNGKFYGALKGLAILAREEFLPSSDFKEILASHLKSVLTRKAGGVALEHALCAFKGVYQKISFDPNSIIKGIMGAPSNPACEKR